MTATLHYGIGSQLVARLLRVRGMEVFDSDHEVSKGCHFGLVCTALDIFVTDFVGGSLLLVCVSFRSFIRAEPKYNVEP